MVWQKLKSLWTFIDKKEQRFWRQHKVEDDESLSPIKPKTYVFYFLDSSGTTRKQNHSKIKCNVDNYLNEPYEYMEFDIKKLRKQVIIHDSQSWYGSINYTDTPCCGDVLVLENTFSDHTDVE